MKKTLCLVAAGFATTTFIHTAFARTGDENASSRIVRLHDLDLSIPEDRIILDASLRRAAFIVCIQPSWRRGVVDAECFRQTLQKTRPQRDASVQRDIRRAARAG